ncbi:DNA repair protein RecO [Thiohalorhabdus sp.]|uniref:DNA repair protein RecO n=1 Tax=Thiohalorhabdus sp. TaxID=3094134 RepID=UPI002FC343DE
MTEAQNAYILHRRPYGETSLLVELFTEDVGRVGLVARGARRPRKGATPLEPFRPLQVTWSGRGELPNLRGSEPLSSPLALRGEALYLAFYLNELLLRLCPRFDPYPLAYGAYQEALAGLASGGRDQPLRAFEAGLLEELGLAPDWQQCARCGRAVTASGAYAWEPELGLICGHCTTAKRPYSGQAVLGLQAEADHLGPEIRRQARDLMRAALAPYLGSRPLESRELLRALHHRGSRG